MPQSSRFTLGKVFLQILAIGVDGLQVLLTTVSEKFLYFLVSKFGIIAELLLTVASFVASEVFDFFIPNITSTILAFLVLTMVLSIIYYLILLLTYLLFPKQSSIITIVTFPMLATFVLVLELIPFLNTFPIWSSFLLLTIFSKKISKML